MWPHRLSASMFLQEPLHVSWQFSLRCSFLPFHLRSGIKSICCASFLLNCGCRWAFLPDLALVITERKLDMEIVLPPLQENLKPTLKHIYTKISRFYTVVIISVIISVFIACSSACGWCQIEIPAHPSSSFNPGFCRSCCLHRHCDALTFPFQPRGLMLLIQRQVGAGLCDPESCRTRLEGGFVRAACSCWTHRFAQYYRWRWMLQWERDLKRFLSLPVGLREYFFFLKANFVFLMNAKL